MKWPVDSSFSAPLELPRGMWLRQLSTADLPGITAALRQWYPTIEVGSESCHLSPAFFATKVFLAGEDATRDIASWVLVDDEQFVAYYSVMRDRGALALVGRLAVINPAFRGHKLGYTIPYLFELIARAMGAGVAYYFVTLSHSFSQAVSERAGFELCGIVPAFDRDVLDDKRVRRVYEAIYAKVFAPSDEVEIPEESSLTEGTRRLWTTLFPDRPLR